MEKSQDSWEEKKRSSRTGRWITPERHWTLMFIGDHGKVITIKHFKGWVAAGIVIVTLALAAAAAVYYFNRILSRENRSLETSVQRLKEQMRALRHDNEILMARLVLAQTRRQEKQGAEPDAPGNDEPNAEVNRQVAVQHQSSGMVEKKTRPPVPPAERKTRKARAGEEKLAVAIENFKIFPVSGSHNLRVQFKLKNTGTSSQRVSGHAIVVLKGDQLQPGQWVSIPRQPLVDGRPTGDHRGYAFGINYFRTMKFTARTPRFAEKYDTATVYVYTRAGRLLLEQDFAVRLPAAAPRKSSGPPSPDALLKVLKNTGQ